MTLAQRIAVGAALLGGGAMGPVIGVLATTWRNRIQPIGVGKELIPFVNKQVGEAGPNIWLEYGGLSSNRVPRPLSWKYLQALKSTSTT